MRQKMKYYLYTTYYINAKTYYKIHIIPRYKREVEKPKGGIRNFKTPLVEY